MASFDFQLDTRRQCFTMGLNMWDYKLRCYGQRREEVRRIMKEPVEIYHSNDENAPHRHDRNKYRYSPEGHYRSTKEKTQPEPDYDECTYYQYTPEEYIPGTTCTNKEEEAEEEHRMARVWAEEILGEIINTVGNMKRTPQRKEN